MALRTLSLCSGAGALDLGVSWAADIRTVCYVEREAFAAATLVARMEDEALDRAPVWDDLATFDGAAWRGAVDLIVAGFPCTPSSTAGRRAGIDDERWLWPDIVRIVRAVGPRLCFFENVPGLLSVNGGTAFHEVVDSLSDLGYDAEWDCFSAAEVGAPHKRDRLFILAHARSLRFKWSTRKGKPSQRGASILPFRRDSTVGDGPPWPPGPADADAWATVLAARPDLAPAIDGRLNPAFVEWLMGWPEGWSMADAGRGGHQRRGVDGELEGAQAAKPRQARQRERDGDPVGNGITTLVGGRADRLRLIGNGVVPQCAAVAFRALADRACTTRWEPPGRPRADTRGVLANRT